jgi:small conductance mechanosensitive channel
MEVMKNNNKILTSPEPTVMVRDLSDTAIHLAIRPWTKNEDFGVVSSDILEQCKIAFEDKKITIQPFTKGITK